MKYLIQTVMFLLIWGNAGAQKQIQVVDQRFQMNAIRNGVPLQIEAKDFGVILNYVTGEFFCKN